MHFSEDVALRVCRLIAEGYSLRKIEKEPDMPSKSAIMQWLLEGEAYKANGEPAHAKALFRDQYARAKEVQADALAEEILEISDEATYDIFIEADGKTVVNMDIQRDRLRVDSRKWLAGKLRPKIYGERIQAEVTGKDGGAVQLEHSIGKLSLEELRKLANGDNA